MSGATSSAIILGFLLATAYGAAFHIILGGPAKRIPLYLAASWFGFALGQVIGDFLNVDFLMVGAVHLFSASLGSWACLFLSRWLAGPLPDRP